jgi:hypothetical protein
MHVPVSLTPPWHSSQGHRSRQAAAHASAQKLCRREKLYFRTEHVYVLKHYLTWKSFADVRELLSNVCPDKKYLTRQKYTDW